MLYHLTKNRLLIRTGLSHYRFANPTRSFTPRFFIQPRRMMTSDERKNPIRDMAKELSALKSNFQQVSKRIQDTSEEISNLETCLMDKVSGKELQEINTIIESFNTSLETHAGKIQNLAKAEQESKSGIEQVRQTVLGAFSAFETNVKQGKLELQQDALTQEKEPIEIQAVKIAAKATHQQTFWLALSILVTLLIAYLTSREDQKELQAFRTTEGRFKQVEKNYETAIETLVDKVENLQSENKNLNYVTKNSYFLWKKEPQINNKKQENMNIIVSPTPKNRR